MSNLQSTYQQRSGWWTLLMLPLFIVWIIALIIGLLVVELSGGDITQAELELPAALMGIPWLLFWGIALLLYRKKGSLVGPIPSVKGNLGAVALGIVFVALTTGIFFSVYEPLRSFMPAWLVSYLLDAPNPFTSETPVWVIVLSLFHIVILAPIVEEIIFRGMALFAMAQKIGFWGAAVISSLLFALMHPDVLGKFIFAMALCYITWQSQSLWPAIIAHFVNNLIAGVALLLMIGEPASNDMVAPWVGAVIMVVSFGLAVWLCRYFSDSNKSAQAL